MACKYCEMDKGIIYEDEEFIAFLKDEPCTPGHTILMPKKHYTILEQVPDDVVGNLFVLSNTISGILFETLGIQGTNVIINNGSNQEVPHFSLEIVPRKEKDGITFDFKPLKLKEDQMDVAEHNIKKGLKGKEKPVEEKPKAKEVTKEKSNFYEKALRRTP